MYIKDKQTRDCFVDIVVLKTCSLGLYEAKQLYIVFKCIY